VIVDSSALIAILNEEPPAPRCLEALLASPATLMSAANLLEAAIAMDRHPSPVLGPALDDLIARLRIAVEPVTLSQVVIARDAHRRFGRGTGHPARLNFGDCFAYALARELDEPLLFVGQDFIHTDVRRILGGVPESGAP
jgi:ribonuclease VapC